MPRRSPSAPHPGLILRKHYLEASGISQCALAHHIGLSSASISRLVACNASMTVDVAQRLAKALGTTAQFWMRLQIEHDLAKAPKTVHISLLWSPRDPVENK